MMKPVIDISYHQDRALFGTDAHLPDWPLLAPNISGAVLRCSYGLWTDPEYNYNRTETARLKIPQAAYGWCLNGISPETQGEYVGRITQGLPWAALDIEKVTNGGVVIQPLRHVDDYLRFWDGFDRVNPDSTKVVYLNPDGAKLIPGGAAKLAGFPLWLANYPLSDDGTLPTWRPQIPAPWKRISMWQYSAKGRLPGVVRTVDMNHIEEADFVLLFGGTTEPETPPTPITIDERVTKLESENDLRRLEINALAASIAVTRPPVSDPVLTPSKNRRYKVAEPATMFIGDKGILRQVVGMKVPAGAIIEISQIAEWVVESRPKGLFGKVVGGVHGQQLGLWVRMKDVKAV